MGFIADMFSRDRGAGFQAQPLQGLTPEQLAAANAGLNRGISLQDAFRQRTQQAGGVQNQSNVFDQQQQLANALMAMITGAGPNPALEQLKQTTNENVKNQAALMASAKGLSPGTAARLIAQQGAQTQQQAAGQAAIMNAQQRLAQTQALQQQQGQMAALATQQAGQEAAATTDLAKLQAVRQQGLLDANVAMQSNINNANAGIAGINAKGQQGILGGVLGGIGSAIGLAEGGEVEKKGPVSRAAMYLRGTDTDPLTEGMTAIGKGIRKAVSPTVKINAGPTQALPAAMKMPGTPLMAARGGKVPVMLSPGEKTLSPKEAEMVARGKSPAAVGKTVPGQAKVPGDSLKNDTVPAELEEGSVVIPRSIMKSKDAPAKAKKFVEAIVAKQMKRRSK